MHTLDIVKTIVSGSFLLRTQCGTTCNVSRFDFKAYPPSQIQIKWRLVEIPLQWEKKRPTGWLVTKCGCRSCLDKLSRFLDTYTNIKYAKQIDSTFTYINWQKLIDIDRTHTNIRSKFMEMCYGVRCNTWASLTCEKKHQYVICL